MPRQRRPSQNRPWGPKLPQKQNLGGGFVVFFLRGQNCKFGKVRGLKDSTKKNDNITTKKEMEIG